MKTPTFNRKHLKEYFFFGGMAALLYLIPLFFYLTNNRYENSYYLYIGNALFFLVIFYYNMRLLYRPYDKSRAVSMLMSGHLTTICGVILSVVAATLLMIAFQPGLFTPKPSDAILSDTPANAEVIRPSGWLFMIYINAIICNFGAGALISIMVSYAGKRNQTKDKPAHVDTHLPSDSESRGADGRQHRHHHA